MRTTGGGLTWLRLSGAVLVLDQLTKHGIEAWLTPYKPWPITRFFDFTLSYNTGAAFSFLADQGGWQRWFFIVLAVVVCVVLTRWLAQLQRHERWPAAGLSLILGGAVGNVIDRAWLGHVIDFIHVFYQDWHFPAFNIADSAITVGVIMLMIDALRR